MELTCFYFTSLIQNLFVFLLVAGFKKKEKKRAYQSDSKINQAYIQRQNKDPKFGTVVRRRHVM